MQNFPQTHSQIYDNYPLIFNNNDGMLSVNIHHKHFYGHKAQETPNNEKSFRRKIEFQKVKSDSSNEENSNSQKDSRNELSSDSEGSVVKKPQPINPSSNSSLMLNPHGEPVFLHPFQHYPLISPEEYQAKKFEELRNKKNFCNCKKSKCLKLYCKCFANGEYCVNCNCTDCSNVLGNEFEKENAFKTVKDKNPVAMKFNPIVSDEKETSGCNCTKSNCSKKYCECYKAGMQCNESCRCRDCSNMPEALREAMKRSFPLIKPQDNHTDYTDSANFDQTKFEIEKISVLIENKNIFINEVKEEEKIKVRHVGKEIFIEISKSLLKDQDHYSNPYLNTLTPIASKFKKRIRNQSFDSEDYSQKQTKTACETNKKVSHYQREKDLPTKKLNLSDLEKCKKNFLK